MAVHAAMNLFISIRNRFCRHTFLLENLRLTNIPEPERPSLAASYYTWLSYFMSLADHPSHAERVEWTCATCRKTFRAHCGLDILSRHGKRL
jgi:hypothetical protein